MSGAHAHAHDTFKLQTNEPVSMHTGVSQLGTRWAPWNNQKDGVGPPSEESQDGSCNCPPLPLLCSTLYTPFHSTHKNKNKGKKHRTPTHTDKPPTCPVHANISSSQQHDTRMAAGSRHTARQADGHYVRNSLAPSPLRPHPPQQPQ
mmetsp:Transcript_36237/g.90445  ORF Transcript_36237/g.90445 Transcript_36237/m.90445 type:complete len:147 (+) Transcript_36237:457-897(+)